MPTDDKYNKQTSSSESDSESLSEKQQQKRQTRKKNRGMYKVVFKGHLKRGFSRATVIDNIVHLTKLPQDKIEQKFFSRKAVIIRRAHDQAHAQKLQQLFSQAGLEVMILQDETVRLTEQKQAEYKQAQKNIKQKKSKQNKLFVILLFITVLFLVTGYYLWYQFQSQMQIPEPVTEIEQALAGEPLIFLAYANYRRLKTIKAAFIDDPDALPGLGSGFFNDLKKSGIDPDSSLSHILVAAYLDNDKLVTQVFLFGQFSVASVKHFLLKYYQAEAVKGVPERLRIAQLNPRNCQIQGYKEVLIEPRRIIISSQGQLDKVLDILQNPKTPHTVLSDWENYRRDKLLAMALFKPQQLAKFGTGLVAMISKDVVQKNTALDSLYASLGVQLLPPLADVNIRLNSKKQNWLAETYKAFIEQLKEMKIESRGLNSVQTLLDHVSIEQNSHRLDAHLKLDSELKESVELSINDFFNSFFSLDEKQADDKNTALQEKINTRPVKYLAQVNSKQLKAFKRQYDPFFSPVWEQGPFALTIQEILLEKDQIVLQLRGKGQNIPNSSNKQARIRIIAVEDSQGNNVLADAQCHKTASTDAYFSSFGLARTSFINNKEVHYNELDLRKKIRLKKAVDFATVKALKAEIDLNLATRTEQISFEKPQDNKMLTRFGSRILFKPSADNVLSYIVSGNEQRILAVRALNKKHQYLSNASSSSMGNLFGSGRSFTKNFYGKIAYIELVYASEIEHLLYPVTISRFPPYATRGQWQYPIEPITLSSLQSWNNNYQNLPPLEFDSNRNGYDSLLASWHKGPFNLGLYSLKTSRHWGTNVRIMIRTPVIDELQHNLSALQVSFKNPQNKEQFKAQAKDTQSRFYLLKAKGYYMNGEFIRDNNKPYMDSTIDFNLPYKDEQRPLESIEGEIIVHLPLSKHSSSFKDLTIGAVWEDVGVRLKIVRLANTVMGFEISGRRDRLLNLSLLDKDNKRISTVAIDYGFGSGTDTDTDKIVLDYQGTPVKALLTVSEGQQQAHYPFKLELK